MASITPRERLTRLVDLASDSGTGSRQELTTELADLLLDWPESYPAMMREPFEALLEKALQDIEPAARGLLAKRFVGSDMPLSVLNALFFDAPLEIKIEILARNAVARNSSIPAAFTVKEQALLVAARAADSLKLADVIASRFGVSRTVAAMVFEDRSAYSLATLCKGARLSRGVFSALAVLTGPAAAHDENYRRLATYDAIPDDGARALLNFWQGETAGQILSAEAA
jgi:hypothetical protein